MRDVIVAEHTPLADSMSKKQEEVGEPPIDRRIKVLSMGAAASGKSCLIKRYCEGKVRPNNGVEELAMPG